MVVERPPLPSREIAFGPTEMTMILIGVMFAAHSYSRSRVSTGGRLTGGITVLGAGVVPVPWRDSSWRLMRRVR